MLSLLNNKNLIVGIGNSWRGDDGVGPKVVAWLKENVAGNDYLIESDLFSLLDVFEKYPQVILVDAVNMGDEPGTVKAFKSHEAKLIIKNNVSSTHGFGLAEIVELAESLGLAKNLQIIGIQVSDVAFGNELSPALQNQWEMVVRRIQELIVATARI